MERANYFSGAAGIESSARKKHSIYIGSEHQDAQEFLIHILESIHVLLNNGETTDDMPDVSDGDRHWEWYERGNQSIIIDQFAGQTRTHMICSFCETPRDNFEAFWLLRFENCLSFFPLNKI